MADTSGRETDIRQTEQAQERRYGCCEEHFPSAAMTPAEQAEHVCPACGWTPSEDDLITSVRCVCGGPIVEIAEGAFCHVGSGGDDLPTDHVAELDDPEWGDDADDCSHPEPERDESISHLGDPEWAYCFGCACVLHLVDGVWVAQPRPRVQ